jgi:hypothetical protein
MPRVPEYSNFQTQVSVQPNVQVQAPSGPNAGSIEAEQTSRLGNAVSQLGGEVARIQHQEQLKADQFRVTDAINKTLAARMDLTTSKERGYSNLQGEAALKREKPLDQDYGDMLGKHISEIEAGLGNDMQRAAYRARADSMLVEFRGNVQAHMSREDKQFRVSTIVGGVELNKNAAQEVWANPTEVSKHKSAIVELMAQNPTGMSPEELKAKTTVQTSAIDSHVITTAIDAGEMTYARDYFNKNKDTMDAKDREQVRKVLEIGNQREKAQSFADDVTAKGLTQAQALELARSKFSGKEEDEAVKEVRNRFSENEQARMQDVKRVANAAWSSVMEKGRIPAGMLADLREKAPEEERQIRDWLEAKARRAKADAAGNETSGFDTYYKMRMMAVDNPAAFSGMDLRKVEPNISKQQLGHLVEIQAGISKNDAKAMESSRVLKSTVNAIKYDIARIGIDMTPKEGTPQAAETAKFFGTLSQALDEKTKTLGRPLTEEEAKVIGNNMVRQGKEQGAWFFPSKKLGYQIIGGEADKSTTFIAKSYDEIPDAIRNDLTNRVRTAEKLGSRPLRREDREAIERAYTAGLESGKYK